ncbi:MAG: hypothetical protein GC193_12875 [Cryomorphaceae bacterium]|nr:hypothetical protein [Cryomorphaceae bacterium]
MSDKERDISEQDQDGNLKRLRKDSFNVPTTYFTDLENQIGQQTFPHDRFDIPAGYFEDLQDSLIAETRDFDVPATYFDTLETTIIAAATPTKIINMKRVAFWLSAACVVGAIFLYRNFTAKEECKTFACLLQESDFTEEELLMFYDSNIVEEFLEEDSEIDSESEAYMDYLIDSDYTIETLLEDE